MTMVEPPPMDPLTGDERLLGVDASVSDFWQFALPDVTTNNVRGWLAEYLVWRAIGVERPVRVEWDAFDVLWDDIRIEVKSSALVQRWAQRRPSTLAFSGLRGKLLDPATNTYAVESTYNADVYVLAVNLAGREQLNQLDIGHWRFAVLSRLALEATGQSTLTWVRAQQLSTAVVGYDELAAAIQEAASG
ncbi:MULTISPECIES: hypothetical protein [Microbacterium]|uniref:hypothetical protein n=1 Tax=Microbacterium TaxID=33882 RepID=UPI0019D28C84|nr:MULTISPECIES: hypothetical protein [Microbacterium]MCE7483698.1 hypothetical protein [Microbacterium profundi]